MNNKELDYSPDFKNGFKTRRFGRLRILAYIFLILIAVIVGTLITVRIYIGPAVKSIDRLPDNFPADIALFQTESAQIKSQNPENQQRLIKILNSTPDWILTPLFGYLSSELQNELYQNFGDKTSISNDFTSKDLIKIIRSADLKRNESITLTWPKLEKSKEELYGFYRQKLAENGFQIKEDLDDYRISIGFWKEKVFGNISIEDNFSEKGMSMAEMKVNYLK